MSQNAGQGGDESWVKRTQYSQKGIDFVTLFRAKFSRVALSGYSPELKDPAGETTGGGKQATQHMVLSSQNPGLPQLTCGSLNVATKTVRLRTFDCMQRLHQLRFRTSLAVSKDEYQKFFGSVSEFMKRQGYQLEIETRPPEVTSSVIPPAGEAAGASGSERAVMVSMLVVLVVVLLIMADKLGYL